LSQVNLDIPDESLDAEIRMAAAMKLYEMSKFSSGAAACLAGVPRVVFLGKLADYGIDSFRYNDLDQETRLA